MAQGPVKISSDPGQWNLHDAVLDSVRFDWKGRSCVVTLIAFLEPGRTGVPCTITFDDVDDLSVPCRRPWGRSVHVNDLTRTDDAFVIEMQSGDPIRVTARSARLDRT